MPKKKKNSDFQKVKFKVGRKIQRATNETKAQLKVKAINVRGQFKQGQTPTTESGKRTVVKDIDIKETLKHCVHRSVGFRLQSLTNLCEFVNSSSDQLDALYNAHLGTVLDVAGTLFVDDDGKVRAEARKLLKLVTGSKSVKTGDIGAFFSLLVARLCCAMTHLHEDIRLDSLQILDIFLEKFPSLIASHSTRLLPNFIGLISRPRQIRADASGHKQQKSSSATLLVNPNSQMSTQKWRVRVIERIGKLFDAIATRTHLRTLSVFADSPVVTCCGNESTSSHHYIVQPNAISLKNIESFSMRPSENECLDCDDENSAVKIQQWIQSLIPLVLECWMESGLKSADQWDTMSSEALSVARGVLSLLLSLFHWVSCGFENSKALVDWMTSNYEKQFTQNIMAEFPYAIGNVHSAKRRKSDSSEPKSFETTSVSINVSICQLMTFFLRPSAASRHSLPSWHCKIIDYVASLLEGDDDTTSRLSSEQLHRIFSLIVSLTELPVSSEACSRLVKACCETASRHEPRSWQSKLWFDFLFKFLLNDSNCTSSPNEDAAKWVAGLPSMLLVCGPANDAHASRILMAVSRAGCRQNAMFLESFNSMLPQLLEPSFVSQLNPESMRSFVGFFSWVPLISTDTFRSLAMLSITCFPPDVVRHLLGVLEYRCESSRSQSCFDVNCFLVLMQTILIRATKIDLERARSDVTDDVFLRVCCDSHAISVMRLKWSEQLDLIKHVFNVTSMMPNKNEVYKVHASFFQHILVTYRSLPLISACSIAVSLIHLQQTNLLTDIERHNIEQLLVGLCLGLGADSAKETSSASTTKEVWRLVAELCGDLVCHVTELVPPLQRFLKSNPLNDQFTACLTSRLHIAQF